MQLDVLTANFAYAAYIRLGVRLSPSFSLLSLPSLPFSLSLALSVSYSPTSASFLTVQFLLFLSLRLSVCERESVRGRGRDRHRYTKTLRQQDIERVRERYAVSMSTYGWSLVCLLKAAVPVN